MGGACAGATLRSMTLPDRSLGDSGHVSDHDALHERFNNSVEVRSGLAAARPAASAVPAGALWWSTDTAVLSRSDGVSAWTVLDHGGLAGLGDNDHPQYSLTSHTHPPQLVVFTSSGTFAKGDYPGLSAVRVRVQGGGGGGGGAATTGSGQVSGGGGGGGGGYVEQLIPAASLGSSHTVTVGAGGAGGVGGANGSSGGFSAFGSFCSGGGGAGGAFSPAATPDAITGGPGAGGTRTGGDFGVTGGHGGNLHAQSVQRVVGGFGGGSHMGGQVSRGWAGATANGSAGVAYGGGGAGAANPQSQVGAGTGGAGAPGVVVVEVFF